MKNTHQRSCAGFTLAEILLAMLVFAIAISTILALLARSIETADEILLKNEAIDLSSALESYLSELPFYDPSSPIDAYSLVQSGQPGGAVVYLFKYRAVPGTGDSLAPFTGDLSQSTIGQQYVEVPAVRTQSAGITANEELARSGRLFHVRLTESPANPFAQQPAGSPVGVGNLPANPNAASGSGGGVAYDSAVLVIFAEFFPIPASGAPPGPDPVFSFNLAVRR